MMSFFEAEGKTAEGLRDTAAPPKAALDEIDRAMIAALLEDGRMSFKTMGERIGLAGDATRERYLRLVSDGVVSVVGVPHPDSLGLHVAAGIGITVTGPVSDVAQHLARIPNISFVATTIGTFDILIEISAASDTALFDAIDTNIRSLPQIQRCNLMRFTNVVKWSNGRDRRADNHAAEPVLLGEEDRSILKMLLRDGRASYKDIADEIGSPYAQVRRRAKFLIESGVVQINTVVNRPAIGVAVVGGVMLRASGRPLPELAAELAAIQGVEIVIIILGAYDILLEVSCPNVRLLNDLLSRIRMTEGVATTETFTYVRYQRLLIQWGLVAISR